MFQQNVKKYSESQEMSLYTTLFQPQSVLELGQELSCMSVWSKRKILLLK